MKSGKETSGEQQNEIDVWSSPSHPFTSQQTVPPNLWRCAPAPWPGRGFRRCGAWLASTKTFVKNRITIKRRPENLLGVVRFRLEKRCWHFGFRAIN